MIAAAAVRSWRAARVAQLSRVHSLRMSRIGAGALAVFIYGIFPAL
jgi:hypothetical protein